MKNEELFHSEEIAKGVIKITGAGNEMMYLIIGTKRAALIDTGVGVGNIKEYVRQFTALPLIVILTHAHVDHSAGSYYFDHVYLTEIDAKLLNSAVKGADSDTNRNAVAGFVSATNPDFAKSLTDQDIVTPFVRDFDPLSDGDLFDLGGLTLEIIACPGHTAGSVMVLIKELRIILFGDACNPYIWLHLPESTGVPEYKQSLCRIKARENDYDRVLLSHGYYETNKKILDVILELCDDIIAGKCDDIPFDTSHFTNAYAAKKESEQDFNIRADGIVGNIVYKK